MFKFFQPVAFFNSIDEICFSVPFWYPVTYDLYSQLPQFISHFKKRKSWAKDKNVWICKPWNMASMDTTVSNDLNEIIRIRETEVPKVLFTAAHDSLLFSKCLFIDHLKRKAHKVYILIAASKISKLEFIQLFWPNF